MAVTNRTMFAVQAVGLAEIFKHTIGKTRLEGMVNYRLALSAPEGESTAGGKQALQHVTLVPEGGGAATMVIATANTVTKEAQLRTFACVAEMHRRRFKGALLLLDQQRYAGLLDKLGAFFKERGFSVATVDGLAAGSRPPRGRGKLMIVCAAALAGIALCLALVALR